jgi:hypothetical protein
VVKERDATIEAQAATAERLRAALAEVEERERAARAEVAAQHTRLEQVGGQLCTSSIAGFQGHLHMHQATWQSKVVSVHIYMQWLQVMLNTCASFMCVYMRTLQCPPPSSHRSNPSWVMQPGVVMSHGT